MIAPILIFIYNRPEYLEKTLESLALNPLVSESTLYFFADGPKKDASIDDLNKISAARQVARKKKWGKEVFVFEQSENLGLANSIIQGVTKIINQTGRVIVLEDDVEVSPYFLQYMNDALMVYENNRKVNGIGSWNFFSNKSTTPDTFFCPIPDTIGWATWSNRWSSFENDSNILLESLKKKNLIAAFNLFGQYNYFGMLLSQSQNKIDSWGIRWQAVAYLSNRLTLYPKYALANHIGIDKSATHSSGVDFSDRIRPASKSVNVENKSVKIEYRVFNEMLSSYEDIFGQIKSKSSFLKYLKSRLQVFIYLFNTNHF